MNRRLLPLWTGLLPILAIHATYLVSAWEGYVPWCFPYIDSCTSISATGRYGSAYYLFKATMLPEAILLVLFWQHCRLRLREWGDPGRAPTIIVTMGIIAAFFLVVYTVALGEAGEIFQLQRRIGIILYFSLTALSELMLTWRLGIVLPTDRTRWLHLGICTGFLVIGVTSVILDSVIPNYDDIEDAFEWVLALLMQSYFVVIFFTFRQK